ncbi:conjugative transfer relaxase/helicase TraI [Entomohabitans teleogrylli]|uniref:conjugative transfer relaxase/helicase TraI n=1 Tax=Entomohabitans teleogrylli TaxID=1384589 RepID=UPI00073D5772|nr:conjugative transfer relaxase/helicase TraI [Entomohabitans teleogrylli]
MLSIGSVAAGAAGYYTDKDNYYFLGNMESLWMGEGAKTLGLEGGVSERDFSEALAGRLPGDISLERMTGGKNTHRPGYDLTFSAPKSVSILAVVGGDEAILDAHKRAVGVVASEIEKMITTRVMEDGHSSLALTGKMLAAAFNHDTSRELDPQLHTHLIVLNATELEGKWRTLSSDTRNKAGFIETVYSLQVALGKIYRHELRQSVESMGYITVETGKNGLWEIEGMPVAPFSQRSQQIREAVGDSASLKSRDVAALDTRRGKERNPDKDELLTDWYARLDKAGFDMGRFRQAAHERAAQGRTEHSVSPVSGAEIGNAVGLAIAGLSEQRTRFTYSEVLSASLSLLSVQKGTPEQVREAIDSAIGDQRLIPLDREKGTFTSSLHLLNELSAQQLADRMLSENKVVAARHGPVSADNRLASLASNPLPLAVVSSRGGSQVMQANILDAAGIAQSRGSTFTVLATDRVGERWLKEHPLMANHVVNVRDLQEEHLTTDSTLIISQAEKLSVKDAVTVLSYARERNVQVLLMDGAGRTGTGNTLQTLEDAGVSRISPAREARIAVEVHSVADKRQRYEALAQDFAAFRKQGERVLAQVSGEREQRALTRDIRQVLQAQGLLGEKSVTISSLIPQWLDSKSRRQTDSYREGMVLEQSGEHGRAGNRYTITRVSAATRTLTLQDAQGVTQAVKLSQMDSQWRLYRQEAITVAEGESLTLLARHDGFKARDSVTVLKVTDRALTVEHNGKRHRLATAEGIKATYGYVTAPGSRQENSGLVLAAVAGRDTSAAMLSTLARGGDQLKLYTPLSLSDAEVKLAKSPLYRPVLSQVNPQRGALPEALDAARDSLMTVEEKSVRQAIAVTQGSEVVFSRLDVMASALPMHPSLTRESVDQELNRQIQQGELIPVPGMKGQVQQQYVTATTLETETRILRMVAEGKNTQSPLMADVDPGIFSGLTEGQQASGRLILENTDRFIGIQGYAGVGKTTQLKSVLAALETLPDGQRPEVVGLAPTHRAVGEMASVGVKAQTVASFLMETERRLQAGDIPDFSQTVFIVDEASMVGNRDTADAMSQIVAGGGRAVLSGDRDQLLSVDSGAPFALMQRRSALDTAIMQDIVRQSPALRPAIYSMIERQVPEALNVIRSVTPDTVERLSGMKAPVSSVMEFVQTRKERAEQGDKVIQAIVEDFTGRTTEARARTLIVAQMNNDKNAINARIHERLQAQGELGRQVTISVLDRVKTHGDHLKSVSGMAKHSGKVVLINNDYYTLRTGARSWGGGYVTLVDDTGQYHPFSAFESSLRDVAIFEPREIAVSVGEKISFSRSDKERGREANRTWTVEAITPEGEIHIARRDERRVLKPGEEMADRHIDYGYAGTAHKAQGASEDYVIALAGVEGGRRFLASHRDAYVALSRVKAHVQVYSDNLDKWTASVTAGNERLTAHDILRKDDDRQADVARAVWERGKPLSDSALGRALLKEQGMEGSEARFISGSRKYPAPHVAWPVWDDHGHQRAVGLSELRLSDDGRLEGPADTLRHLGSEEAVNVLYRSSQNGETMVVQTLQEARELAADNQETGIIIRADGAPAEWLSRRISGGDVKADADPLSLKTPEEQRLEKALDNEVSQHRNPSEESRADDAERQVAEQLHREEVAEKTVSRQQESHEAAREQKSDPVGQLRQNERELVKEKTLAG